MPDGLPPLKAVRCFEAAARLKSFSAAADELHVTHSAISHQIKTLEDWFGCRLFRRLNRKVALTPEGEVFLPAVTAAFGLIGNAARVVQRTQSGGGALTVSVVPSFGIKWLGPRLGRFREQHPDIDVRISTTEKMVDFAQENVDMAIRYGIGPWEGLHSDLLFPGDMVVVCSPALAKKTKLRHPADLAQHVLLWDHEWQQDDWRLWFNLAGVPDLKPHKAISLTLGSMMAQVAMDGLGVGLLHRYLVDDDLKAGRLMQPFPQILKNTRSYFLVIPQQLIKRPQITAFRQWILNEAGQVKFT